MNLSGQFWPIHLHPKEDELLSSWILRLARGHALKLETFCNLAWGRDKQIWNRDIDRLADPAFLHILHRKTGISEERVWQTTLASLEGRLADRINPHGNARFVLPLGIYHRIRSRYGMQFCPDCLADGEQYYRRTWRLALATVCTRHRQLLHDHCPKCATAINFHRGEMGSREKVQSKPPCFCHLCGYDLRGAPEQKVPPHALNTLVLWQRKFEAALSDGWIEFPRRNILYSHLFFDGVRILLGVICSNKRAESLRWYLAERAPWTQPLPFLRPMQEFEREDVIARAKSLFWAEQLLEEWPTRFVNWCLGTKTLSSNFTRDCPVLPFWLDSAVRRNLHVTFSNLPGGPKTARSYDEAGELTSRKRRISRGNSYLE